MEKLFTDSHNTIRLKDVVLQPEGSPVVDATAVFTLYESDGTEVGGQGWPLTLVAGGDGTYTGTLDDTLEIKHNWEYSGVCDCISLDGSRLSIKCPMIAKDRDCCE